MSPFGELLEKLARADVRYVLVGGGAVLLHGHARTTGDLDIVVEASEENAVRLLRALAAWGEGAGTELTVEELAYPQMGCLRIVEEFALDVFTMMMGRRSGRSLLYADLITDAPRKTVGSGIIVSYASIAHLIELKAGTGRPKDDSDIAILEEIARGSRERIRVDLAATKPEPKADPDESDQGEWPQSPDERNRPRN